MPFLRWARLFYNKKADRLYAPDIMLETCRVANEYGYTFFLYGGMPGAPDKIEGLSQTTIRWNPSRGKVLTSFPGSESGGGPTDLRHDQRGPTRYSIRWSRIAQTGCWIAEHRERIRGSILIASGATFDFFSGRIQQAPEWIRNAGLEWLFRLTKDFRRLWVRYTVYNLIFVVHVWAPVGGNSALRSGGVELWLSHLLSKLHH